MSYDLVVIGGGVAGLAAARAARWAGASVALVADGPLGGDCTFTGCVPSKTLISAANRGMSFTEAMAEVQRVIAVIASTENDEVLTGEGVDVIRGRARFVDATRIEVEGSTVTGGRFVIATGSRPLVAKIDGLAGVDHLTNENVFDLVAAPSSIGILGGGAGGCELAQAFARLGVRVSLFEAVDRLLPSEEPEASAIVAQSLRADGVDLHIGVPVKKIESDGARGGARIEAGKSMVTVEQVLVALGRVPNTAGLDCEAVGVRLDDRGHVRTDDRLKTAVETIYAAGDVTGRLPFTHAADEMGRLAAGNALGKGMRGKHRTHWTPWCTFTDPEVARVGLTEAEASRKGGRVAYLPLSELDRAITDGRTDGYIKLIAGPRPVTRRAYGGRIIGATIVGPRAGELIHEPALAMRTGMMVGRLAQAVHAYPTWSYGIQKAAAQFFVEVEGRRARKASRRE